MSWRIPCFRWSIPKFSVNGKCFWAIFWKGQRSAKTHLDFTSFESNVVVDDSINLVLSLHQSIFIILITTKLHIIIKKKPSFFSFYYTRFTHRKSCTRWVFLSGFSKLSLSLCPFFSCFLSFKVDSQKAMKIYGIFFLYDLKWTMDKMQRIFSSSFKDDEFVLYAKKLLK